MTKNELKTLAMSICSRGGANKMDEINMLLEYGRISKEDAEYLKTIC